MLAGCLFWSNKRASARLHITSEHCTPSSKWGDCLQGNLWSRLCQLQDTNQKKNGNHLMALSIQWDPTLQNLLLEASQPNGNPSNHYRVHVYKERNWCLQEIQKSECLHRFGVLPVNSFILSTCLTLESINVILPFWQLEGLWTVYGTFTTRNSIADEIHLQNIRATDGVWKTSLEQRRDSETLRFTYVNIHMLLTLLFSLVTQLMCQIS